MANIEYIGEYEQEDKNKWRRVGFEANFNKIQDNKKNPRVHHNKIVGEALKRCSSIRDRIKFLKSILGDDNYQGGQAEDVEEGNGEGDSEGSEDMISEVQDYDPKGAPPALLPYEDVDQGVLPDEGGGAGGAPGGENANQASGDGEGEKPAESSEEEEEEEEQEEEEEEEGKEEEEEGEKEDGNREGVADKKVGEGFSLDKNGQRYVIKNGKSIFVDDEGNKIYRGERGEIYYPDEGDSRYATNEDGKRFSVKEDEDGNIDLVMVEEYDDDDDDQDVVDGKPKETVNGEATGNEQDSRVQDVGGEGGGDGFEEEEGGGVLDATEYEYGDELPLPQRKRSVNPSKNNISGTMYDHLVDEDGDTNRKGGVNANSQMIPADVIRAMNEQRMQSFNDQSAMVGLRGD